MVFHRFFPFFHGFPASFPLPRPAVWTPQGLQRCGLRSFAEATLKALLRQREREAREAEDEAGPWGDLMEIFIGKDGVMGENGEFEWEMMMELMGISIR